MYLKRSKHIDIKYHWTQEKVEEDVVVHQTHVRTNDMVADILTKPLSSKPFERPVGNITGMKNCNANCAERFSAGSYHAATWCH